MKVQKDKINNRVNQFLLLTKYICANLEILLVPGPNLNFLCQIHMIYIQWRKVTAKDR